ncbi:hypothetical protein O1611_g4917 [Lasiodiplodia mahajangana]|uniref:Uncharacterized protein n=1 Tax=Lasiodiplodia mahajangana TaxID=1108764 RepID=A0ACC2JN12_9PEZI|nr:hypothetical protein O1611_g4917 [Lasiodiplodia mahajangana]
MTLSSLGNYAKPENGAQKKSNEALSRDFGLVLSGTIDWTPTIYFPSSAIVFTDKTLFYLNLGGYFHHNLGSLLDST